MSLLTNSSRLTVRSARSCSSATVSRLIAQSYRFLSSDNSVFVITGTMDAKKPAIGMYSEITHVFSQEEVNKFSAICGDNNPIHTNPEFAKGTMFNGTIVHGILTSSLFSTLFGRSVHGSVYVSQTLKFKRPVHVGRFVVARIEVIAMEEKKKGILATCSTICKFENDNSVAVEGEAKVLLPHNT